MPSTAVSTGTAIFGSGKYGDGDLSSHYAVDYKKYDTSSIVRRSVKPQTHLSNAPFEGVSTNTEYYAPPPADQARTQPIQPPASSFSSQTGPLDSLSSYAASFTGQTMPRVQSMKPVNKALRNDAPFESSTTSRATYQPWASKPREPYRLKSNLGGNLGTTGSLDYHTESSAQYNDKGLAVRKSLKPEREALKPTGTFEGISVAQQDYIDWKQPPREIIRGPADHRKPLKEERDFVSEAARQFGEKPYQTPARSMRPPRTNAALSTGEFLDETTAGSAFVPYEGARPATPKEAATGSSIKHGDLPFQGTTSYSNQFKGQTQPRVASMRPRQDPVSTGTFQSSTTYRQSHQPWNQKPAQILRPNAQGSHWYLTGTGSEQTYQTEHSSSFNDKGCVVRRSFNPGKITKGII